MVTHMLSAALTGIQPFVARAGCRQLRFSPAATRSRCESGAACSSSRRFAPRLLRVSADKQRSRPRSHTLIVGGPQPDTEEEGSALDFPEVSAFSTRRIFRSQHLVSEFVRWGYHTASQASLISSLSNLRRLARSMIIATTFI